MDTRQSTVSRQHLGVLISGRGTNLAAIVRAIARGRLDASIRVVVSNVAAAEGLRIASDAGIPTVVLPHQMHAGREAYDRALVEVLREHGVGLVCLAGFMRLLGPAFCATFPHRVLNIHPSLLPAFPGVQAQAQALAHGVLVTGATVHLVTPDLDAGPIVAQRAVRVRDDDSVETLSARILAAEHAIYPAAIQRLIHEPWRIDGRRVRFARPGEPLR